MKFAVCSMYNENYTELANITIGINAQKYCDRHGYDLVVKNDNFTTISSDGTSIDFSYEKTKLILDTLKTNKYDWVYWRGADTMITNMDIELRDMVTIFDFFIIGCDVHNINADSFFIRNCDKAIEFFTEVLTTRQNYIDDQQAFHLLYPKYQYKVLPQKHINSYDYNLYLSTEAFNVNGPQPECAPKVDIFGLNGQWSSGDFLIHWPGISYAKRIELAKQVLQNDSI